MNKLLVILLMIEVFIFILLIGRMHYSLNKRIIEENDQIREALVDLSEIIMNHTKPIVRKEDERNYTLQ